jgi:hypothetical protein
MRIQKLNGAADPKYFLGKIVSKTNGKTGDIYR